MSAPRVRPATVDDLPALRALIDRSVRGLSGGHYTPAQVESGLRHVFGPDTQLIADGTYYVIDGDGGALAAAGGWSGRRTLYGGDQTKGGDDPRLDPAVDPARIRAFFVDPAYARRGLARTLFAQCLAGAHAAGFRSLELMATLPGEPLYRALGFTAGERVAQTLPDGVALPLTRMSRPVDPVSAARAAARPAEATPVTVAAADPDAPDARALIGELSDTLAAVTGEDGRATFGAADVRAPRALFVVARDAAGAAVGCGALRPLDDDAGVAEVKRMYARPGTRGVGTAVLAHLEDAARAFGYAALWLETGVTNEGAIAFYERRGYRVIPCFGPYVDCAYSVCLAKRLAPEAGA
jgi:GNAT superfamily N-acetyltransferase